MILQIDVRTCPEFQTDDNQMRLKLESMLPFHAFTMCVIIPHSYD